MEPEKKTNGALVGLIIIIIILVVGGLYIWQKNQNATNGTNGTNSQAETAVTSQDSADLNALQNDLNATDTNIGADAVNSVQ